MADLGRFQLGDYVPIMVMSVDADVAPSWPTACPTFKTFAHDNVTSIVETLRPMARDIQRVTGLFYFPIRLSSSYTTGKVYVVTQSWAIGGSTFRTTDIFRVTTGGDADGNVIGCTFYRRPEAGVVVYCLDGGKLKSARNPR